MKMIQDLNQESGILLMITVMEIIVRVMMCDLLLSLCDYSGAYILVTGNIKVQKVMMPQEKQLRTVTHLLEPLLN